MDGSVIDYLEEYIEQIIMEEFKEPEYEQDKLSFMEEMIISRPVLRKSQMPVGL